MKSQSTSLAGAPAQPASGSLVHRLRFDPWWRARALEALVLGGVAALVLTAAYNVRTNLAKRQIASGFGFLDQPAGFDVTMALIPYEASRATHLDVLMVGIVNTLVVSLCAIVAATLLGFLLGLVRLSGNWLGERLAIIYIEVVRNVPILLQLLFWYVCVVRTLPGQRESIEVAGAAFLNNRGLFLPAPIAAPGLVPSMVALGAGVLASVALALWAQRRRSATGRGFPVALMAPVLLIGPIALATAIWGAPVQWDLPVLRGFNFRGGMSVIPEFVALFLGLTVYIAAFIAEIVRSGVLAVDRGQTEAGRALGLSASRIRWLIVVPQAMRVMIPPLTTQYLNLLKNSSLGIAIGYPDIVAVFAGTSLNQTGQALEVIAITMAFYLTISLAISAAMNWYNARMALPGAGR